MERFRLNEAKEVDSVLSVFKKNYQSLEKSDENNQDFSIINILSNEDKQPSAYHCIYRYKDHFVKLEYDLANGTWKILSQDDKLNILLDDLNNNQNLSLDQQIQIIIKRFYRHFSEINENGENKITICSISKEDDDEIKYLNNRSNELSLNHISTPSTIPEDDEPISPDLNPKMDRLFPLVVPNRTRHESSNSTASSVKYATFVPPSMESVSRKRVIQTMVLHVQHKRKTLEKLVDTLTGKPSISTIYELGLQFLRIYDGKFNYPQGHTFDMLFRNKNWLLTIDYIQYVKYEFNEFEQSSLLILNYQNKFIHVKL